MNEPENRPAGELLYRTATLTNVSFPQREIEMIVMPYETETIVERDGRMVHEIINRGAFDGIERRANRIRVNRDHQRERTVGRAISFQTSHQDGLIGRVRIAKTPLGDETLQLAEEEILDASAGFLPFPGGEQWETRNRVRMRKCWLGHIAMTPDPAYEGARVLAVRSSSTVASTPFLDEVRAWRLEQLYPSG